MNQDWDNYTVTVHAVKSNSFNIGANPLGEMCLELEQAGKKLRIGEEISEQESVIKLKHPHMLRLYRETVKEAEEYLKSPMEEK